MKMKLFPWDNDIRPYWVNPENDLEWYVDKDTTNWCIRETLNSLPKLDAVVFYVTENIEDKVNPITRVLIDHKTNDVLAEETSLEAMATKIDILRLAKHYNEEG